MVLSGGRLAKETNNEGGVKDFTVTPVTDEDDKIHNAQDVNVINSNDIEVKMTGEGLATSAKQADLDAHNASKVSLYDSNGNAVAPVTSVGITPPTAIADGNKTVTTAGTAVKLVASTTACQYVAITALLANTGLISVGGSTTIARGTIKGDVLAAGDSTVVLIDDVSKVYINSTVNSEGVSFRYG